MTEARPDFQRARKPAERELRRETILAAAAELFDAEGPLGAGINAIAARAGFTKSNLYRYFESREHVLLALFLNEFVAVRRDIARRLAAVPPGDADAIAAGLAASLVAHPRFCALVSVLFSVLEQNVSTTAVMTHKREMLRLGADLTATLQQHLPDVPPADCQWLLSILFMTLAGLWPATNPTAAPVLEVLAKPEFAVMHLDVEAELRRLARALIGSIAPERKQTSA